MNKFFGRPPWSVMAALLALTGIRLLPAWQSPLASYGYDFGFYAGAFCGRQESWQEIFSSAASGGYLNPAFAMACRLGLAAQPFLTGWNLAAALALGMVMAWWLQTENPDSNRKYLAILLLASSLAQTELFLSFLLKNQLALPLLALALIFLEQRRFSALAFIAALLIMTHRTTAIVLAVILTLYSLYALGKKIPGHWQAALAAALGLSLWPLSQVNPMPALGDGLFMNQVNLWEAFLPSLLLAIPGIVLYLKNRPGKAWPIFFGLAACWLTFRLPFYRRIIPYFDLGLVAFGAYFLSSFSYRLPAARMALAFLIIGLVIRGAGFSLAQAPLIAPSEIQEIKTIPHGGFVLALSANDAPWLLAYAPRQRLGAPGLLEDPQTKENWEKFWAGDIQRHFLSRYPRPLYLYLRSFRPEPQGLARCLLPLSPNLAEVDFSCLEKNF